MKTLTILTLLGATLTLTIPAQAWIGFRRPVVVTPYVAPYSYAVPTYYRPPVTVYETPAPTVVYETPAPVVTPPATPIGTSVYSLPPGAKEATINGVQYYVAGSTFFRPNFGPNGVYYLVVASPI